MKVKDVMNKYPITVHADTPISQVAHLLVTHHMTAIPVVDTNDETLIGIITEGDLLYKKVRPHAPHYVNVLGASIYYSGIGEYNAQFKKLLAAHVDEMMSKEVITCHEDQEIEEVVGVMLEKHLKNIPVVSKNNRLLGLLSRHDVVQLIAKENVE